MKPNHVQRDVRAGKRRAIGEAPSIPRVGRVTKVQQKQRSRLYSRRSDAEERMGESRSGMPLGVMVLLALVTFGLLGGAFVFWVRPILDRGRETGMAGARETTAGSLKRPEVTAPSEKELQELVEQAMKVTEPSQVGLFFHPGSAPAEEVVAFLKEMEEKDGKIVRYDSMPAMVTNGFPVEGVLVTFEGGEDGRKPNRLALLTPNEEGVWKVDFPAYQRRAEPSWKQFLGHEAESAVVRVYVARDNYYNGAFSNEEIWRCYGIASPDEEELMFGYCRRDSDQDRAIWRILHDEPRGMARATLELGWVEGGSGRQFEVKRVLANDWVVGKEMFDER